jgi:phosphoribosylformylglycinamidine synthase
MDAVGARADGGLVLGICNGFQVLCEAGLLPARCARTTRSRLFAATCRWQLSVPTRLHGSMHEGTASQHPDQTRRRLLLRRPELLSELEASGQVVLRYEGESPNGSVAGIAGVVNAEGNVMGLMPHPNTRSTR